MWRDWRSCGIKNRESILGIRRSYVATGGLKMPCKPMEKTCAFCGAAWVTRSKTARTCSPLCRARLREIEHGPTRGATPREYSTEIVSKVRAMYEAGATIAEIQAVTPGVKVQNLIKKIGIETRSAVKRNQLRENNDSWKGDSASYTAMHLRVYAQRGRPSECSRCGKSSPGRYEWANLTGDYSNVLDYARMCVPCHRKFDSQRRKETGRRTSPRR